MASKGNSHAPYFFIFDFYIMQGSSDSNDVLPLAVVYFYPNDEQKKKDKLLDCGEIVGMIQYFQHDLFRSMIRALYFQKLCVVHKHFGRHSGILCVPDDQYSVEEAHVYLTHILNLFHMLHGTWNHIQSIYEKENTVTDFLNQTLTPIVNYVFNQHRTLTNLFSTIDYIPLKNGHQRVLLNSKHFLNHLKSKYGLRDGFIGYEDKMLYSTADPDTTYLLQILCQGKNEISESMMIVPWESESKLRSGVTLYRIHLRRPIIPTVSEKNSTNTSTSATTVPTNNVPIFQVTPEVDDASDNSPPTSSVMNPNQLSVPSSSYDSRRRGIMILTDHSGSSEETGFDTDTGDERPTQRNSDPMSSSSFSLGDTGNELHTEESEDESVTIARVTHVPEREERTGSHSSTTSEDHPFDRTIKIEGRLSIDDAPLRLHFTHVDSFDTSEDEESFEVIHRTNTYHTRERSHTFTSDDGIDEGEHIRNEVQVSWTNIPEKNTENERDQLVLYVQKNSEMIFVGIVEQSLLTDDYLNKLWSLMLSQLAEIEPEIHINPTARETIKLATDVKFEFNENTRLVEFKRYFDGIRGYRRLPLEESTYMAFFARTELDRYPDRRVIGVSQGSYFISLDRRLPDRIFYSCQRYQETL